MIATETLDWPTRWRSLGQPFDQAAVVSLFVLVPPPDRAGMVTVVVLAVLAAVVVLTPAVRRSPWPWLAFAAMHAWWYVPGWYRLDNHDALILYWAVALAVAASVPGRAALASLQARAMLAVTFLLAVGWKLASGQFLTGDFFAFTMVHDQRFGRLVQSLAGVGPEQVAGNREALRDAGTSLQPSAISFDGIEAVLPYAMVLTVGTIVLELAVAVLMALPDRPGRELLRSAALGAFLVGTYAIVPVPRFGLVLMAMGIAQASTRRRVRLAFVVGAVTLGLWAIIWIPVVLVVA